MALGRAFLLLLDLDLPAGAMSFMFFSIHCMESQEETSRSL